jgi:hypothetical protein
MMLLEPQFWLALALLGRRESSWLVNNINLSSIGVLYCTSTSSYNKLVLLLVASSVVVGVQYYSIGEGKETSKIVLQ